MLIQFNFKNHKSYLNETSLDMAASSYHELGSNLLEYKNDEKYFKVLAIYGANESGKSNVLDAFKSMQFWIRNSFSMSEQVKEIPLGKFRFTEKSKNETALYEVYFSINESEYQYGFELNEFEIQKEWLYKRDFSFKSKYRLIFQRLGKETNLSKELKAAEALIKSINEKTLLLTLLANLEFNDVKNVYNWFTDTIVVDFGDAESNFNLDRILPDIEDESSIEHVQLANYLKAIGSSISDIRIEKDEQYSENKGGKPTYNAYSVHTGSNEKTKYELPLAEESSGTRKMITLFTFFMDALSRGKTLFIDEMDAKLHPLLTRYIIDLFNNSESNRHGAQLIFTTHDTNTLTKELLRRDQIWFADKDANGISELFSLADFKINNSKVRNDATYNKDYLGGRYGAIPNLDTLKVSE